MDDRTRGEEVSGDRLSVIGEEKRMRDERTMDDGRGERRRGER